MGLCTLAFTPANHSMDLGSCGFLSHSSFQGRSGSQGSESALGPRFVGGEHYGDAGLLVPIYLAGRSEQDCERPRPKHNKGLQLTAR